MFPPFVSPLSPLSLVCLSFVSPLPIFCFPLSLLCLSFVSHLSLLCLSFVSSSFIFYTFSFLLRLSISLFLSPSLSLLGSIANHVSNSVLVDDCAQHSQARCYNAGLPFSQSLSHKLGNTAPAQSIAGLQGSMPATIAAHAASGIAPIGRQMRI